MRDPEDYSAVAVLIECPEAGTLVPTGIHVETHHDLESTNLLLDCPDCGQDHPWEPADAVLASAPPPNRATVAGVGASHHR
jgi:hypothetical protein